MPIFDQGYQHWSGVLAGHTWRWLTITRHGVRVSMKNIILRLAVIASWFPAVVLAAMLCAWGLVEHRSSLSATVLPLLEMFFPRKMLDNATEYRVEAWTVCYYYFLLFEVQISMIVVLLVGPSLISQDLRFNALPLYLSRPLRRIDYFAGKLGVVAWFLAMVVVFPSIAAYVLGLLFSMDLTIIRDTYHVLLAALAYGAVIVVSAGPLMLALSSLSRNSRYIALFWVGLWFVSATTGTFLDGINTEQRNQRNRMLLWQAQQQTGQRVPGVFEPGKERVMNPEEQDAARSAQAEAVEKVKKLKQQIEEEDRQARETNWRPLLTYTGNLSAIGNHLLQIDPAKKKLSAVYNPDDPDGTYREWQGPQYPWYWSAIVLAVLFGISVWILQTRVRSLDRLK